MQDKIVNYANYNDQDALEAMFVGKKIVKVERLHTNGASLTLSDGRQYYLEGNEGCGGCVEGHYPLTQLSYHGALAENIITAVKVEESWLDEDQYGNVFQLYIFAENLQLKLAEFEGSDNGYYGMGFTVRLKG